MSKVSLFVYKVECENVGFSKDPLLTETSNYAILFGQELNSEVSTSGLLFG
jgi:endoribonuclease Dicer